MADEIKIYVDWFTTTTDILESGNDYYDIDRAREAVKAGETLYPQNYCETYPAIVEFTGPKTFKAVDGNIYRIMNK